MTFDRHIGCSHFNQCRFMIHDDPWYIYFSLPFLFLFFLALDSYDYSFTIIISHYYRCEFDSTALIHAYEIYNTSAYFHLWLTVMTNPIVQMHISLIHIAYSSYSNALTTKSWMHLWLIWMQQLCDILAFWMCQGWRSRFSISYLCGTAKASRNFAKQIITLYQSCEAFRVI